MRILSLCAAAACAAMALFPSPCGAAATDNLSDGHEISLGRVFTKVNAGKPITIAYLGGSITNGTVTDNGDGKNNGNLYSWRARTSAWFQNLYVSKGLKASLVTSINAGDGGTGSDFGAYRVARDVIAEKPDLVFVEFAVNDDYSTYNNYAEFFSGGNTSDAAKDDAVKAHLDGIVRQIYRALPGTDIVFIETIDAKMHDATASGNDCYGHGILPPTVADDLAVANHYTIPNVNSIPVINVGKVLWDFVQSGYTTWDWALPGGYHPSDVGYGIYFDNSNAAGFDLAIEQVLVKHEHDAPMRAFTSLPAPAIEHPTENPWLVDPARVALPAGWSLLPSTAVNGNYYPDRPAGAMLANVSPFPKELVGTAGTQLDYAFANADEVGIEYDLMPDGGTNNLIAWVDDGPRAAIGTNGLYADPKGTMVARNVTTGAHTLHLKVVTGAAHIQAIVLNRPVIGAMLGKRPSQEIESGAKAH